MREINIYMKRDIFRKKGLSDEGLAVYIALRFNYGVIKVTSINSLVWTLLGEYDSNKRFITKIKSGIDNLIKLGLISIIQSKNNELVINCENMNINMEEKSKETYSTIRLDELHRVMSARAPRFEVLSFLRYSAIVFDSVYTTTKYGCIEIETMANTANITKMTALSYNTKLEELGLLYIHRFNITVRENDGTFRRLPNSYGRPEDKGIILAGAIERTRKGNDINVDRALRRKKSNIDSRAISAQYNNFINGKFKGNLEQLIKDCELYNEVYSKKKDMSVFTINEPITKSQDVAKDKLEWGFGTIPNDNETCHGVFPLQLEATNEPIEDLVSTTIDNTPITNTSVIEQVNSVYESFMKDKIVDDKSNNVQKPWLRLKKTKVMSTESPLINTSPTTKKPKETKMIDMSQFEELED